MNNEANIRDSAGKFSRARGTLAVVVLFTLVNMFLLLFGSDFYLLFSATVPFLLTWEAVDHAAFFGFDAFAITFIFLAFLGTIFYVVFWLLSGRYRVFMLVAMIFFIVDTIIFLGYLGLIFLMGYGFDFFFLLDLAIQVWIMVSLISGTIAWARLRGVTREQLEEAKIVTENRFTNRALDEVAGSADSENSGENTNNGNDGENNGGQQ